MKDYIDLASSPLNEDCAQVGSPDYHERSRLELRELKRMMEAVHPSSIPGAYYAAKTFPHDFGSYSELCAIFDDEDEAAAEWAYEAEDHVPDDWDEEATLALSAYPNVYLSAEERETLKWMEERRSG